MNSSLPPPAQQAAPFGSAVGAALDVIVIVPASSSSLSSSCTDLPPAPTTTGVVASSDFFVTFPTGMAWNPLSPQSSFRKTLSKSSMRSLFYSKSTSSLQSNTARTNSTNSSESIREESEAELNEEVGVEVGHMHLDSESYSEHGTSCTEPHAMLPTQQISQPQSQLKSQSTHPNRNVMQRQLQNRRRGNVQIQINGRNIPQLEMLFSAKRTNNISTTFLGSTTTSEDEPSCRFVNGNGLRPSTDILKMLVDGESDETLNAETQQSCTCHESIRNSEHHMCTQQFIPKDQSNITNQRRGTVLNYGRNLLRYTLYSKGGTLLATAESHLYLWKSIDSVIVSDVDGTITKSDITGVFNTVIQDKFDYCHEGICKLFHEISTFARGASNSTVDTSIKEEEDSFAQNANDHYQHNQSKLPSSTEDGEIRFLYLSSRPISLISQTRKLLVSLSQECNAKNIYCLPSGPIMCHTGPLTSVLYSELFAKDIHKFKSDVLARQVVIPFVAARGQSIVTLSRRNLSDSCIDNGHDNINNTRQSLGGISEASSSFCDDRLFLAGFGNKLTDAMAYEMAGIDRRDIYIIDKESRILCMGSNDDYVAQAVSAERSISNDSEAANTTIAENHGILCDQPDWPPLADVCCPGGINGQLVTELSAPASVNDAPSSNGNKVASSIHSIELSLSSEERTAVDIYVKDDQQYQNTTATSKRARFKQTIRAFSSKASLKRFPSFGSSTSVRKKKLFDGYGDPLLLARVRERING